MCKSLKDVTVSPFYEEIFSESLDWLDYINSEGDLVDPKRQLMDRFMVNEDTAIAMFKAWVDANQ